MLLVMYQKNKFDLDTSLQRDMWCIILCLSWVKPFIKKGVLCKECKVRFFLTYYMHLVLKYIFNTFDYLFTWISCEQTTFSLVLVKMQRGRDWGHKQRRLLWMSMTILRNSTGINGLYDLLNEPLMPQEFHVPASRGYGKRKLTLVEMIFQLQLKQTVHTLMIFIEKPSDEKSTTSIRPKSLWHMPSCLLY